MEMRRCPRCTQEKPVTDFGVKVVRDGKLLRQAYCIRCQREYRKEHYRANQATYLTRKRQRDGRIREMVEKAKARPCADCGIQYPAWVMDFDHVSGNKVEKLAELVRKKASVRRVEAEIAKCEVVCANCHRDRTHRRRLAQ